MIKVKTAVFVALVTAAFGGGWRPCLAQVLFDRIEPRPPAMSDIAPKGYRAEPYRTKAVPSKPYEPMPHFHNRNILPDRIQMAPLSQSNIRPSHIRPDRITFGAMTKDEIAPEPVQMGPLVRGISPGLRMTAPATPSAPQWSFDLAMEAAAKPTTRFDSSLRLAMPDYDAPNRQRIILPPSHPMSW